jgi:hypothetical protein
MMTWAAYFYFREEALSEAIQSVAEPGYRGKRIGSVLILCCLTRIFQSWPVNLFLCRMGNACLVSPREQAF